MYILASQFKGLAVISLQHGPLGHVTRPLIDLGRLSLMAFLCEVPEEGERVLLVRDVRQVKAKEIVIESADDLSPPADIVRLQGLLSRRTDLVKLPVVNESGLKLGRVEDFTVSPPDFIVQKLHIRQTPLKNLLMNRLVVDRSQIIEVTPKKIVIQDATVKGALFAPGSVAPE